MSKPQLDLSQNNHLTCAFYAIIGILLIVLKAGSLGILMTIIGVLFIALGVMDIVKGNNLTKAIVNIAIGAVIIVCGWLIADIVLLVFGILLIVKGVTDIAKNYKAGFETLLSPIACIVIGVLLVVSKWALLDVMCVIAGILFIVNAVLTLFGKAIKK